MTRRRRARYVFAVIALVALGGAIYAGTTFTVGNGAAKGRHGREVGSPVRPLPKVHGLMEFPLADPESQTHDSR